MHLQIDVEHRDGYTVLSPQGEIDFATGPQLKDAITDALVSGEVHVVVDLLRVDFIESTGLGALIGGRRRALALNGSLTLVAQDQQVLKVFRITGLDTVFTIVDTVEAATGVPPAPGPGGDQSRFPKHRASGDHE
jgi:anti-sigma B factor antagonist